MYVLSESAFVKSLLGCMSGSRSACLESALVSNSLSVALFCCTASQPHVIDDVGCPVNRICFCGSVLTVFGIVLVYL